MRHGQPAVHAASAGFWWAFVFEGAVRLWIAGLLAAGLRASAVTYWGVYRSVGGKSRRAFPGLCFIGLDGLPAGFGLTLRTEPDTAP